MEPLLERLRRRPPIIADGAIGTLLFEMVPDLGPCPESINLTHPETLGEIARRYLDAGAEIIQTNTFGASPMKLALNGLASEAPALNRAAVQSVRAAVGQRAYVSGSCGPSGKLLKPFGDATPEELYDNFRTQIAALLDAGVDVICIETMTDLNEAVQAVRAAKDLAHDAPVMATMTFDPSPRGFHTIMGVTIEKAAAGLCAAGADVVGTNCGNGIENMVAIAREFRRVTDAPLLIQSNAGLPELRAGRPVYPETPEFMADRARELLRLGVTIVGGCCGTTPEHIRALRALVDNAAA